MKEKTSKALRQKRRTLLKKLPPLEEILRGSLIERYKRCGKPGCKCAKSSGHGPKYYLSVSKPKQKPEMDYVPLKYQTQVKQHLENFRLIKTILEELCEINRELLRRREKL
ncbi:MAG: hypothetical protein GY847_25655 [Proteobacteria bacterium]|nr:hypothetical protein [Pseudomonadota bacterium]